MEKEYFDLAIQFGLAGIMLFLKKEKLEKIMSKLKINPKWIKYVRPLGVLILIGTIASILRIVFFK